MPNLIQTLDRRYRDPRGVIVRVIAFDRINQRVIFMREGWPDECFRPLKDFQDNFVRVDQ
ncbi:DUF4222 domain-containing protein [Rouxiella chamberiensis]|uniref:DUF4222 domain-containing protein n=2 Tax=Rouxiella chamberiensis TaxID=1513468 RepID=A0ABY7HQ36_9GAMM|nr:DUF4222 domain-containing protein [Rouxiella chamberiensis]WAT01498.1 DUF4222 domain-containing protein [Rouxiella chamberiensis]